MAAQTASQQRLIESSILVETLSGSNERLINAGRGAKIKHATRATVQGVVLANAKPLTIRSTR
jgi:hypothetical protein